MLSDFNPTYCSIFIFFKKCVSVVFQAESDAAEEDVFHEESGLLSPLHTETIDPPDTPVSLQ